MAGPVEMDPEYQLIVEANNLTVEIDNEISKLFICNLKTKITVTYLPTPFEGYSFIAW